MNREDEIRLIAYKIWEDENYPSGKDYEHWLKAEAIWEAGNSMVGFKSPKQEAKTLPEKKLSHLHLNKSKN